MIRSSQKIASASCETPTILRTISDQPAQIMDADLVGCVVDAI